ncbi:hypothetical protein [Roseibium album]|uniref:Uncharacterized protein n=1 Tax=Roseibium album TaxID=311410 RepID=A0A0M6Z8K9_9HYPH|nr:hypothetical protein [Roseibium album]CTQ58470.1 hypothetical protein LA5094_01231 [Roseibium album]CTQ66555.1 hypothetical protein LA5096_01142 [Roseibium album]CTQ71657.1 hypothetical protein LA5095_02286 [Roseibium album]
MEVVLARTCNSNCSTEQASCLASRLAALINTGEYFKSQIMTALSGYSYALGVVQFDEARNGWILSDQPASHPVLTVIAADNAPRDAEAEAAFMSQLACLPWTPDIVLARLHGGEKNFAKIESLVLHHYAGANLRWVSLDETSKDTQSPLWWSMQATGNRINVLSTGGVMSRKLRTLQQSLQTGGFEVDLVELSQETDPAGPEAPLILDISADWALPPKRRLSKAASKKNDEAFEAWQNTRIFALSELEAAVKGQIVVLLPEPETEIKSIVDGVLPEQYADLNLTRLPHEAFVPLGYQVNKLGDKTRANLATVLAGDRDELEERLAQREAEGRAFEGALTVAEHRKAEDTAKEAGDLQQQIDERIDHARIRIGQMVEHIFADLKSRLAAGNYSGVGGKKKGQGSRDWGRWGDDAVREDWVEWEDDSKRNFLQSRLDALKTVRPSETVTEFIADALAERCYQTAHTAGLIYELYFATILSGEIANLEIAVAANGSLPRSLRRTSTVPADRAAAAMSAAKIKASVAKPPEIEKVPATKNFKLRSKSYRTLVRQGLKIGGVFVLGASILGLSKENLLKGVPANGFLSNLLSFTPSISACSTDVGQACFMSLALAGGFWLGLLVVAALPVWLGLLTVRDMQGEKLDKLRDDTHRVYEAAATTLIGPAKQEFLQAVERDLEILRAQLKAIATGLKADKSRNDARGTGRLKDALSASKTAINDLLAEIKENEAVVKSSRSDAKKSLRSKIRLAGLELT